MFFAGRSGKAPVAADDHNVDVRFFDKYRKNYGEIYEDQILYGDMILFSHQKGSRIRY